MNRHAECELLNRLVEAVQLGKSQALVVCGEPGVGKTALLEYLVGRARGCQLVRAAGVECETELAFAGLHQLCAPLLARDRRLPGPQRDALRTALGVSVGPAPDRFLVGLAVLGLLAEVATDRPLVCVVDDAQWLDRASVQAMTFVARRLVAESVALVFAARVTDQMAEFTGLAQLEVGGLPDDDARTLVGSVLYGPQDKAVVDRVVAETRGNPLALLELPRGLTAAELAGGFGPVHASAVAKQIEDSYRRQLAPLDPDTRRLMLIAAAEPVGDPVLVWRAAERLGIGVKAVAPATAAGLLDIDARVRFRHPLLRSVIYQAASVEERRGAHRALAEATDSDTDPDRRAWHRAQAAHQPDEDVAGELECSAGRAQARGGLAAAAAFLERAAELTPNAAHRAQRALAAAHATYQAGAPDAALRLLSLAEAATLDKLSQARAQLLRARITSTTGHAGDAAPLLLRAAQRLEPLNATLSRDTYLEALWAAWLAGGTGAREVAQAVRAAPPAPQPARAVDLLLDGLATLLTDGYAAGIPMLKHALRTFGDPNLPREQGLRWFWLACVLGAHVWDEKAWEALASRQIQLAREAGELAVLSPALNARIAVHACLGELDAAGSLVEELAAVTEATGIELAPYGLLVLAGWRGREADAVKLFEATCTEARRRGEGVGLTAVRWASALLYNSLSRYEDALTAARQASNQSHVTVFSTWGLVELIEAAARSGNTERAGEALQRLTERTHANGSEWPLGIQARCRALLSNGPTAETAYREAIDRLGRTRIHGERARAHLLYGEWLCRQRRPLDAREWLRLAHETFTAMGAEAFAQRAARELRVTGEVTRKGTAEPSTELTSQEARIARLAREGLSNTEIATRMFLSPRTVEWHLSRIFTKLQITSRRQLSNCKHL